MPEPDPAAVLARAVTVCVENRKFEGVKLRELTLALGTDLGPARKPLCQMGYPRIHLVAPGGERMDLKFCGQYGAVRAQVSADATLHVRDPVGVDAWLRSIGEVIRVHDYGRGDL
jgi:hypothetical protein